MNVDGSPLPMFLPNTTLRDPMATAVSSNSSRCVLNRTPLVNVAVSSMGCARADCDDGPRGSHLG